MFDIPDNSVYQLGASLLLLTTGFVGQWFFYRLKPLPASVKPGVEQAVRRRNKIYRDASLMVIGFGAFALLHFLHAARRLGIQW
jgi:hypothetical protein